RFEGRVEQVVSGRAIRFNLLDELIEFMDQVLKDAVQTAVCWEDATNHWQAKDFKMQDKLRFTIRVIILMGLLLAVYAKAQNAISDVEPIAALRALSGSRVIVAADPA